MKIEVTEEPMTFLAEYSRIPISFNVERILDVEAGTDGSGALRFSERPVELAYVKDYDSIGGEGPSQWPRRFDISGWGLFSARSGDRLVGAAAVGFNTEGLEMLEGRSDLAVLWDIRVSPEARSQGIGSMLLRAAEAWAVKMGCRELKVETQNINVPACRFYARHGLVLTSVQPSAYPEFPDEIRLLWYKNLSCEIQGRAYIA